MEFKEYVLNNNLGEILENIDLSYLTTIGVGGKCKYLYLPNNINSLCLAYKYLYIHEIKSFVIGKGSNILHISDYYDGVIISLKLLKKEINLYDKYLVVSSNVGLSYLLNYMSNMNLGDLSFLAGIPGSVGGAIYMNAGAFGDEIKNHLIEVKYINKEGKIITLSNSELKMEYRKSIFMDISGIIIEAKIKCGKNIFTKDKINSIINKRKIIHPYNEKSMGSVFKNLPNIKAYEVIKDLGLDNYSVGDALISPKHSNFIVNKGNATYKDILQIINEIKTKALSKGIKLEEEIILFE
ncbi:MAG: UDP-N-acetylmuramate dehydrogenase [Anaeroplasmataceae bacterium]